MVKTTEEEIVACLVWFIICNNHGLSYRGSFTSYWDVYKEEYTPRRLLTPDLARGIIDVISRNNKGIKSLRDGNISSLSHEVQETIQTRVVKYESMHADDIENLKVTTVRPMEYGKEKQLTKCADISTHTSDGTEQNHLDSQSDTPQVMTSPFLNDGAIIAQTRFDEEERISAVATTAGRVLPTLSEVEILKRQHAEALKRKDEEIRAVRANAEKEMQILVEQHANRAQEVHDLRAQAVHRKMAKEELDKSGRDPREDIFFHYSEMNHGLRQRIKEMQDQIRFYRKTSGKSGSDTSFHESVDQLMEKMSSELEGVLRGCDNSFKLHLPSVNLGEDLTSLFKSVLSVQSISDTELSALDGTIDRFEHEPELVLYTLASAAVREWVFQSDFPNFDADRSSLLRAYRKSVRTIEGWTAAHNLEVGAYCSLIEEPQFKTVTIRQRASSLTCRFSRAFAALLHSRNGSGLYVEFDPWGQISEVGNNIRHRLEGFFSAALELKSKSVVREISVDYIVYPFGKMLNETSLSHHLFGSIFIHKGSSEIGDHLVILNNFASRSASGNHEYQHRADLTIFKEASQEQFHIDPPPITDMIPAPNGTASQAPVVENLYSHGGFEPVSEVRTQRSRPSTRTKGHTELLERIQLPKSAPKEYQCLNCFTNHTENFSLRRHYANGICGRCSECQKADTRRALKIHIQTKHREHTFENLFKEYKPLEKSSSSAIKATISPQPEVSKRSARLQKSLYGFPERRLRSGEALAQYKCIACGRRFQDQLEHEAHWIEDHPVHVPDRVIDSDETVSGEHTAGEVLGSRVVKSASPVQAHLLAIGTSDRSSTSHSCEVIIPHSCKISGHMAGDKVLGDGETEVSCIICQVLFLPKNRKRKRTSDLKPS